MAWEGPHLLLPPVLLLLLASGSWVKGAVPEELHKHPGQTLLLQCQYSPKTGPYQSKTWCQQTSPDWCTILVTSSKPRTAVQKSRYTIWDEPDAGFFNITMIQLTQNDSGFYWCGIYNTSKKVITVLRDINLVVSPDKMEPRKCGNWRPCWCVEG
uniref:Triggering receptor expressed on myeloid cells like 4 n=1 Tax=Theropithecus gelada TaxID=9565 RepID=A0A8D2GPE7_THEGE